MPNTALNRTTQALLTNKSGGALVYGDVVVLDNTNASSFTTTTTAGLDTRGLGVILEPNGIANNASGMVAIGGWCPKVNLNTAATVGQLIKTHTVAGQATPHSSPQVAGDFAYVLEASATPAALLFGKANASAGTGDVVGPAASIADEVVLYDGTTGKLIKRSSLTGIAKQTSGVQSLAVDGTDYLSPSTGIKRLAQIVTAASQSTVDFTSISGSYSAVKVVWMSQDTTAGTGSSGLRLMMNNDSTAGNYTATARIGSEGGSAFATTQAANTKGQQVSLQPNAGNTGKVVNGELVIAGYAATTFQKRWTAFSGWSTATFGDGVMTSSGLWANTAAVTRLTFGTDGTAFTDGSTFTLYGMS